MSGLPSFKSDFLEDIVFAIKKRRKALKHKVSKFSVERVTEKSEGETYEKLELEFRSTLRQISLRFYFWEDRVAWFDVRESSKTGWVFEWNLEGRIGQTHPKGIIDAIETSIDIVVCQNPTVVYEKLDCLWRAILLTGPKRI